MQNLFIKIQKNLRNKPIDIFPTVVSVACHDPDFDPAKESHQMALILVSLLCSSEKERTVFKRKENGLKWM